LCNTVTHTGTAPNKKPVQVLTVGGATTNNWYAIIETTIYRDVSKGAQVAPIITRSQRALIGPGKSKATPLSLKLEIPTPPVRIETYGATQVMTKVGQFVGVVGGPKGAAVGAGIAGMAALTDYAVHVAEQELNKLYQNQQYRINLIEIVPVAYYTINTSTNQVELKPGAEDSFLAYKQQQDRYLKALKEYQDMNARYAQSHARVQALSGAGLSKAQFEQTMAQSTRLLKETYEREVKPRLEAKNREETKFSRMYPPYRIAIMASPAEVGNACKQFGQGQGPWELSVIYYIGAQQTNQNAVKYCVPNTKDDQFLEVTLMHNNTKQIDTKNKIQEFIPGGIKIAGELKSSQTSGNPNVSFARATGPRGGDYGASDTGVLNWFTHMIAHPEAGGIAQFMIPFDIYELREGVAKQLRETNDEKMEKILDSMDKVIAQGAAARQTWDTYKQEQKAQKEKEAQAVPAPASSAAPAAAQEAGGEAAETSEVPAEGSATPSAEEAASEPGQKPATSPVVSEESKGEPTTASKVQKKKSKILKLTEQEKAQAKIVGGLASDVYETYGPPADPKTQKTIQQLRQAGERLERVTGKQ